MLVIGDNFSYGGAKPLDARLNYNTLAQMKAVADSTMYNGCMAYCSESDKTYQWKSTNTVDETTGKWREFSSGGGGGSYTAGDGITIDDDEISIDPMPAEDVDEVIDVYPTAGNLVSIVNAFNRGDLYSTDEKMIGQWIDGKPLYQKSFDINISLTNRQDWFILIDTTSYNIDSLIKIDERSVCANNQWVSAVQMNFAQLSYFNNQVAAFKITDFAVTIKTITIQYTKTTDTAISIGEATEYSTEEKVVGTWIDGKPLYQKTIETPFTNINAGERKYIPIIPNISQIGIDVINAFGFIKLTSGSKYFIPQYLTETFAGVTDNNSAYMTMVIGNNFSLLIKQNFVNEAISGNAYVTLQYTKTT